MAKKKEQKREREYANWLIPDRLLVAQTRYNLRRLKREAAQYPGASALINQKVDELIWLLDSAKLDDANYK